MKKVLIPLVAVALMGCADFVDEDGNTSIRQVAEGLQSFGDRMAEMGEALERDADIRAVPWTELSEVIPTRVDGNPYIDIDGDDATDRNGAGMSMAAGHYMVGGDSMFVGVADLGALRSGAQLALRWIAPAFGRGDFEGDVEEISVDGHPAIRIVDEDDGGVLIAMLVEGRFAVVAGAGGRDREALLREALEDVDYRQLRRWIGYGS